MNEFNKTSGSGNASTGNPAGSLSGGNRRRFPRRGTRKPVAAAQRPNIVAHDAVRKPIQGKDILSSGLKDALALGSLEGAVARSQAYKNSSAQPSRSVEANTRGQYPTQRQQRPAGQSIAHSKPRSAGPGGKPSTGKPQGQSVVATIEKSATKKSARKQAGGRGGRRQQFPVKIELATTKGGNISNDLPPAGNHLRIIPLGGQEEVGRNMTVFEYGDDIVIVDMGVQWPEEDMPGVDYIVPNVNYLKGKEKRIRGVIFTHGHLDHIGGAPILLKQLGYPTIIGRDFTLALIKHKVEDHEQGAASRLKTIRIGKLEDRLRLGAF
ncbi:MAG: ribonuclease J, partial [Candidatus Moranbacteria bacterium]|nr:ribonuclease J [Candidatus Moranbacteria bacterium]